MAEAQGADGGVLESRRCLFTPRGFTAEDTMTPEQQQAERRDEIIRRCLAGESLRTVASDFGVSRQRISQIVREMPRSAVPNLR